MQGRRGFRLDRDYADFPGVPGGDAADQPAAADRDQECVDFRQIGLDFQSDGALAEHRLRLVVSVDREGAALSDKLLAGAEGIGINLAPDHEFGAVVADPFELGGRGNAGNEDRRAQPEPLRGIGDGHSVIPAGSGSNPSRWRRAGQEVGEGAARLERAGMLQEFELQRDRLAVEAEIGGSDADDRRVPDIRPDQPLGGGDVLAVDRRGQGYRGHRPIIKPVVGLTHYHKALSSR